MRDIEKALEFERKILAEGREKPNAGIASYDIKKRTPRKPKVTNKS